MPTNNPSGQVDLFAATEGVAIAGNTDVASFTDGHTDDVRGRHFRDHALASHDCGAYRHIRRLAAPINNPSEISDIADTLAMRVSAYVARLGRNDFYMSFSRPNFFLFLEHDPFPKTGTDAASSAGQDFSGSCSSVAHDSSRRGTEHEGGQAVVRRPH